MFLLVELAKYFVEKDKEFLYYVVFSLFLTVGKATICYKNEEIGNRTGNVYYCNSEETPECCQEDGQFTCCEVQSEKTLREQLILWGSLAGVIFLIALIIFYFCNDVQCCKDDTPLKEKCCGCCKKREDEEDLTPVPEPSGSTSYSLSPRSGTLENLYRDTPVPSFHYKPKY